MKKPKTQAAARATPPDPEALFATAQAHAAAGRWREAIAAFKDLVRLDNRPAWRLALADAYAGRARELAAKGMPKEALMIWENRAALLPDQPMAEDHLKLLLRLGRVAQVVEYAVRRGDLESVQLASLRTHLAALHLAGEPAVAAGLPADDPILTQGASAAAALDAWCAGDDATLRTALAAIPFRSPYRDLAQIIKALQRLPAVTPPAVGEVTALLARVPDDSGFAPLRRAVELALSTPDELPARVAASGAATRRFALTLAGWGEARQALWDEVRYSADPGPQTLLRLLHRHRAVLGEDWARRQALRLLIPGFPKSAGWISEAGGRRLSEEERALLNAWRSENSRTLNDFDAWDAYVRHLIKGVRPEPGSDAALRIAMVLRRADQRLNLLAQIHSAADADEEDDEVAQAVEQSLAYDPDDGGTYERLVRYYLRGDDLKSARRILDLGLARLPKDLDLLTAAMDCALASDAFKKAARYAREILDLDPINTGARERLVKAHLAHARKQLRTGRVDLAGKELAQAADWSAGWDPGGRLSERRALLGCLIELASNPRQGEDGLRAQAQALGGGMTAAFVLAQECQAVGRPVARMLKTAGFGKVPVPDRADLMAFLARLRADLDEGVVLADEVVSQFDKPVAVAASRLSVREDLESACETLRRAGLNVACGAFAEAALRRWPGAPIFELYRFETRQAGRRSPSSADLNRLEEAFERAHEAGDERTAFRIQERLAESSPFAPRGRGRRRGSVFEDAFEGGFDLERALSEMDPGEALRGVVEVLGFDVVLKMMGLGPKEIKKFKEMERMVGRDRVIEILGMLMRDGPDGKTRGWADDDDPEQFKLF